MMEWGSWRCGFQRVPLVTGHIHLDFAPQGFCLPHFLPSIAKPEEISLCRCWAPAIMRFEGHQSASFIDRMKNRPEMQMSHCADEHESASSGARHKGMKQVWTAEKFGKWVSGYVSKISCLYLNPDTNHVVMKGRRGLQSEKWHF